MYFGIVAPAGWLFLDGSVIANAQTLYPDLWAVAPAGLKSGASLHLPNMANMFVSGPGATALATAGGSDTLSQANLPAVGITIDTPSTAVTIDPPATAVTGSTGNQSVHHYHQIPSAIGVVPSSLGTRQITLTGPDALIIGTGSTDNDNSNHTHPAGTLAVDIAPFNTNVDIAAFTSGNLGSGTPFAPPHLALNFIVRAY
jgi:hypothetical protein